ncbi:MAG: hypothetical protein P8N76_08970 [Pirellulaceae bacterium]|nr:hypothetical protein [Pirellulaceae bacterium]
MLFSLAISKFDGSIVTLCYGEVGSEAGRVASYPPIEQWSAPKGERRDMLAQLSIAGDFNSTAAVSLLLGTFFSWEFGWKFGWEFGWIVACSIHHLSDGARPLRLAEKRHCSWGADMPTMSVVRVLSLLYPDFFSLGACSWLK